MREFEQAMSVAAQRAGDAKQDTRCGLIDSYDPDAYSVKVRLQPSNVLTGWIPIASCYVGNGWGMQVGPTIGDAVVLEAQEGGGDAAIVTGSMFNDVERPMSVPSGEFWIRHKSGSFLKFKNNGDVELNTEHDLIATVGNDLSATVDGKATIDVAGTADLTVGGTLTSTAPQWNHNGPVSINGTLDVKFQIRGTGGFGVTTLFGNVGGAAASITGNIVANNGTFNGTTWDFVADGYSLKGHKHTNVTNGLNTSGPATP
jgi:phage baseplate assembly protein gpV